MCCADGGCSIVYVTFEVKKAVTLTNFVVWEVTPCLLVEMN